MNRTGNKEKEVTEKSFENASSDWTDKTYEIWNM
jgi:hypothetical protein